MSPAFYAPLYAGSLLIGMVAMTEVGRRIGTRRLKQDPEGARLGLGAIESAMFALLGLMIAFTFHYAAARLDQRRVLIVEEANLISTAWARIDLVPEGARPALRQRFRGYLDARLLEYRRYNDRQASRAAFDRATQLQREIWALAADAVRDQGAPAPSLLLAAINPMIDMSVTRTMATRIHPPSIVYVMLATLALTGALLAGVQMAGSARRSWLHILVFAGIISGTMYVVLDLEYPRYGFIRVDDFDQALHQVRVEMEGP